MKLQQFEHGGYISPHESVQARHAVGQVAMVNEHIPHLVALFNQLDERGQKTTLAMLAVAVKLHPKKDKP